MFRNRHFVARASKRVPPRRTRRKPIRGGSARSIPAANGPAQGHPLRVTRLCRQIVQKYFPNCRWTIETRSKLRVLRASNIESVVGWCRQAGPLAAWPMNCSCILGTPAIHGGRILRAEPTWMYSRRVLSAYTTPPRSSNRVLTQCQSYYVRVTEVLVS